MARALLIVDPQRDFIDGALPVPGAARAMDSLAAFAARDSWALKIITCDFHPWNHCSFKDNGGPWPRHCVRHSEGAAIWPGLMRPVFGSPVFSAVLLKGENEHKDEYSIFAAAGGQVDALLAGHAIDGVDICGIAGDVCVLNTLKDGVARYGAGMFTVLRGFSPSLDGGAALADFCQKENICVR